MWSIDASKICNNRILIVSLPNRETKLQTDLRFFHMFFLIICFFLLSIFKISNGYEIFFWMNYTRLMGHSISVSCKSYDSSFWPRKSGFSTTVQWCEIKYHENPKILQLSQYLSKVSATEDSKNFFFNDKLLNTFASNGCQVNKHKIII